MNAAVKVALVLFTVVLMVGCLGTGGGGPGDGADQPLGPDEAEIEEPGQPSNESGGNNTTEGDDDRSITVIQKNEQRVDQQQEQGQEQDQEQDQKATADADADAEADGGESASKSESRSVSSSKSESESESKSESKSKSTSDADAESKSSADADADADSDADSDSDSDSDSDADNDSDIDNDSDSDTDGEPAAPSVEFLGCSEVEITGAFDAGELGVTYFAHDGIDSDIIDVPAVSDDDAVTRITVESLGGSVGEAVNGYWFTGVYLQYGDGEDLSESNPEDCADEIRPAAPSMTFVSAEAVDEDTVVVTFGYENPNDVAMDVAPAVTEGTVDDPTPIDEFEPGEGEFTVAWTPAAPDETVVVEADLSRFGHDETIRAETGSADEYLEFEFEADDETGSNATDEEDSEPETDEADTGEAEDGSDESDADSADDGDSDDEGNESNDAARVPA